MISGRLLCVCLVSALWLMGAAVAAKATTPTEERLQQIERRAYIDAPQVTNADIATFLSQAKDLSAGQQQRLEFIRLRNLALMGHQAQALQGLIVLLGQDTTAVLRFRTLASASNLAANLENWPLAFSLLEQGLQHVGDAADDVDASRFYSVASYLHSLVGDQARTGEMAKLALQLAERSENVAAQCHALATMGIANDRLLAFEEAKRLRIQQLDMCKKANEIVFVANAEFGLGQIASAQGKHVEALRWAEQALASYQKGGYAGGIQQARLSVAETLIALRREYSRARALLADASVYFGKERVFASVAEAEHGLAALAESEGDFAKALGHMKAERQAIQEAERAERSRRLAYMQVKFDTRVKEQKIDLLETERRLASAEIEEAKHRQWQFAYGLVALCSTLLLLFVLLHRSVRQRQRYRWQSEHDGLTRLYLYTPVLQMGEAALAKARKTGEPFTAIVLDVDLFKQINDQYGHAAGDEALQALAEWIRLSIGERDIAGRRGGDEFIILCKGDVMQAESIMQRLRGHVAPITAVGNTFKFSISAGLCQAAEDAETLAQVIHKADQALLHAKQQGRDCSVIHDAAALPVQGQDNKTGLVVVGSGIQFGRHISERALSEIREADVVMCLTDPYALAMVTAMRADSVNLGLYYTAGTDRRVIYRQIDAAIMQEVRAGKRVCAVFYGHPGVYADVPHQVIRKARSEGYPARMEPGISAEACLYADLGLDPGRYGVQSLEATFFLHHNRQPDTSAVVLLWQVALAGDLSCTRFQADREGVQALVNALLAWYPADHGVILYEAARLPIESPRIERIALQHLADATLQEYTTLLIPPRGVPQTDISWEFAAC